MVFSSNLMLLSMFFISSIHAAAIPRVARRNPITGRAVQSHGLSTEALLTLIGVCVAVLGLVLTLVQLWPSLRIRWGLCTSRQLRRRSRFHPISTSSSAIALVDGHANQGTSVQLTESWTQSSNGGEIPRPQRVQSCYTERQRALMRRAQTS